MGNCLCKDIPSDDTTGILVPLQGRRAFPATAHPHPLIQGPGEEAYGMGAGEGRTDRRRAMEGLQPAGMGGLPGMTFVPPFHPPIPPQGGEAYGFGAGEGRTARKNAMRGVHPMGGMPGGSQHLEAGFGGAHGFQGLGPEHYRGAGPLGMQDFGLEAYGMGLGQMGGGGGGGGRRRANVMMGAFGQPHGMHMHPHPILPQGPENYGFGPGQMASGAGLGGHGQGGRRRSRASRQGHGSRF